MSAWMAIATSAVVAPGGRIRILVDGDELVLWRGAHGEARVFSNRCPHRGMRLSFGFVRHESLICPYHGWRYGSDGRCVAIPAHPDLTPPATIRVAARRVAERAGLIFVAEEAAEPVDPPPVPDGDYSPCRSIFADVDLAEMETALMRDLPLGWAISRDPFFVLRGVSPNGIPFSAFIALQRPEKGVAAAHVSVAAPDSSATSFLANWLAKRRDLAGGAVR